jgi:hypothetical protein
MAIRIDLRRPRDERVDIDQRDETARTCFAHRFGDSGK